VFLSLSQVCNVWRQRKNHHIPESRAHRTSGYLKQRHELLQGLIEVTSYPSTSIQDSGSGWHMFDTYASMFQFQGRHVLYFAFDDWLCRHPCTELSDPAKRHFQNIPMWTWLSKIFHDHLFLALDLLSLSAMMKPQFSPSSLCGDCCVIVTNDVCVVAAIRGRSI
jgi:hypothetical protein